jgi:hypothetical protein
MRSTHKVPVCVHCVPDTGGYHGKMVGACDIDEEKETNEVAIVEV